MLQLLLATLSKPHTLQKPIPWALSRGGMGYERVDCIASAVRQPELATHPDCTYQIIKSHFNRLQSTLRLSIQLGGGPLTYTSRKWHAILRWWCVSDR